jgi:predicted GNAT family acetyltransferase
MLLSGGAILGDVSTHPPAFVVLQATTGQMAVVGHPSQDTIQAAARQAQEIIALPENADWTTAALPDWIGEPATIHVLGQSPRLPPVPPGTVRRLAAEEVSALSGLPPDLREELLVEAQAGTPIAAAFADERPVAFCYAGSVTERWWDVSIDTVEPYRRQGYAARCAAYCITEMARAGKQPVWGALVSNHASAGLAVKLGFEPVDSIFVFSRQVDKTPKLCSVTR